MSSCGPAWFTEALDTADALTQNARDRPPKIDVHYVWLYDDVTPEGDRIFVHWVWTRFDSVEDKKREGDQQVTTSGETEKMNEEGGSHEDHQACVWTVHRVSAPI